MKKPVFRHCRKSRGIMIRWNGRTNRFHICDADIASACYLSWMAEWRMSLKAVKPVKIDRHGVIVSGHHRARVAKELGLKVMVELN